MRIRVPRGRAVEVLDYPPFFSSWMLNLPLGSLGRLNRLTLFLQ